MAKKLPSTGAWRGLAAVTASLLAISVGATSIVQNNAAFINQKLGLTSYKIVDTAEGEEKDSIYFKSEFSSLQELIEAKEALAAEIASEGTVLFKNLDNTLPLDISSENVTLWGLNSVNPTLGGMIGSSVSIYADGGQKQYNIVDALTEKGFTLNQDMLKLYQSEDVNGTYGRKNGHSLGPSFGKVYENPAAYKIGEAPDSIYKDDVLKSADDTAAIVVLSRDNSEAADYNPNMKSADENDSYERPLALSDNEKAVIALAKEHSTKVIVLINSDNPIEIEDLKNDDEIGAIVWTGAPGMDGFLGAADVLSGTVNPSGHIADTYAVNSASAPALVNFGVYMYTNNSQDGSGDQLTEDNKGDWYLVESENIYTGYKYYETRYEDSVLGQGNADAEDGATNGGAWNWDDEVSYSFGYGLSYTTFEQKLDSVELEVGGTGTAKATVTNTGDVAGKSVVQLYVQAPYTEGGLEKSAIQLIGFGKTAVLEPGASEEVTIEFDPQYMASYDENAAKADGTTGAWSLEAGDYYFAIGNGAHEALNNVLANKNGNEDGLVMTADTEEINADNAVKWNLADTDIETYSAGVENQLQDMDINKLIEGTVEYTTRSDWTKGWTPVEAITPTEAMMVGLRDELYTLNENSDGEATWGVDSGMKLIDMMTFNEDDTYAGAVDFDDPMWDTLLNQITLDEAINFAEHAGDDFENLDSIQVAKVYANDGPLGYTGDQVGGYFVRWSEDQKGVNPYYIAEGDDYAGYRMAVMPTEPVVAATFNKELIEREGELLGEDGLWSKESSIFAPGLNLHRSVYCARNHEYYSEDSVLSAFLGAKTIEGAQKYGVIAAPKHIAFNDSEVNRTGVATFMTEQKAREGELRAMQASIEDAKALGAMTAYNRVGVYTDNAHPTLLKNIVRGEWGFQGLMSEDFIMDPSYVTLKEAVLNGVTMSCNTGESTMAAVSGYYPYWTLENVQNDPELTAALKQAMTWQAYALANSNAMDGYASSTRIEKVRTWYDNALTGVAIVFALLTLLNIVMYFKARKKED